MVSTHCTYTHTRTKRERKREGERGRERGRREARAGNAGLTLARFLRHSVQALGVTTPRPRLRFEFWALDVEPGVLPAVACEVEAVVWGVLPVLGWLGPEGVWLLLSRLSMATRRKRRRRGGGGSGGEVETMRRRATQLTGRSRVVLCWSCIGAT